MRDAGSGATVVGVGNAWRGDDGAGPAVARRLRGLAGVRVLELDGDPAALLDALDGAGAAIVIDAVRSGAPPGTIHRLDAAELPAGLRGASSHALGVTEALALGRALDRLPARLELYGIEAGALGPGPRLTPAVARAVDTLAAELRARLSRAAPAAR